jgi:hypothetical protein
LSCKPFEEFAIGKHHQTASPIHRSSSLNIPRNRPE